MKSHHTTYLTQCILPRRTLHLSRQILALQSPGSPRLRTSLANPTTPIPEPEGQTLERVLTHLSISTPPEGGYGWINVLTVFLINAHTWGLNSSYSVFLAHYLPSLFQRCHGEDQYGGRGELSRGLFALAIWTNAESYGVLVFFALVMGTVAGTFFATISPLSAEVVGLESVPSALNIVWLVLVLPCTFSEAIGLSTVQSVGTVKGEGGSFLGASLFSGFVYMGAALCLFLLRGWKIAQADGINSAMGTNPDAAIVETEKEGEAKQEADEGRWHVLRNMTRWMKV